MVSFSGLCSLMNFPSYWRLYLCQMSFSRMHVSLAEVQLSLSCSKGWVSGETPAGHPQPTPNLMQFLWPFWLAKPVSSLHKNSTLWHLINKRTPWPEYTFGRKRTQKTSSHPCIHGCHLVGRHCSAYRESALCHLLAWQVLAMRGGQVER